MALANNKAIMARREQKRDELLAATEQSRQEAKKAYRGAQVEVFMTRAQLEKQRANYKAASQNVDRMTQELEAARTSGEYTEQQLMEREKELALKRQSLDQMSADLEAAEEERARLQAELTMTQDKLSEFARVAQEQEKMVITLNGSVLFKVGESTLMPVAQDRLNEVAAVLKEQKGKSIIVEGHTDAQGSEEDNKILSQERARAVRNYLVSQGVDANMIVAQGMGESQPIASNKTPEGRANNRRVEIVLGASEQRVSQR